MYKTISKTFKKFKHYLKNTSGNVAVIFALICVPLVGVAGAALDYSRLASERSQVQESIDAALLAAINETQAMIAEGKSQTEAIEIGKQIAKDYYRVALIDRSVVPNGVFEPNIVANGNIIEGSATVTGTIDTSLLAVLGLADGSYSADSVVKTSAPGFIEIHFVVDNSNSMGIGATQQDMLTMQNSAMNCAFACHVPADATSWTSTLSDARNLGVQLRIDVVKDAVNQMLANIDNAGLGVQVKSAVYSLSNTLTQLQPATNIHSDSISALNSINLAGDWGQGGTTFDFSLNELEQRIGTSGSGNSAMNARKIVVFVTDGVASNLIYERGGVEDVASDKNFQSYGPVLNGAAGDAWSIEGFNPNACRDLKEVNNANIFTVNVEYVTPPNVKDDDKRFKEIRKTLKDSIEQNLRACASSNDQFFTANSPAEIYDTFDKILDQLLLSDLILAQ